MSAAIIELQMSAADCLLGAAERHARAAMQAVHRTPIEPVRPVGAGLHKLIDTAHHREKERHTWTHMDTH